MKTPKVLAFTPGDPAGIGPDLAVMLADFDTADKIVIIADREVLAARAKLLGQNLSLRDYQPDVLNAGLEILHTECTFSVTPGCGDPHHTRYVIDALDRAIDGCLSNEFDALVTGPINKEAIIRSGFDFMGHTEYLALRTGADCPVMLLTSENMKVALVTTHLPLNQVAAQVTCPKVVEIGRVLHRDLVNRFGIQSPRIGVCGLNPHAGEGGKLGNEELTQINPAIEILSQEGINVSGPHPADTLFASHRLAQLDAVLAMYHDQGLPVIKHSSFGKIVNVTLGLPIVRTSVDHGTAYDIAGRGVADSGSLHHALTLANQLSARAQQ